MSPYGIAEVSPQTSCIMLMEDMGAIFEWGGGILKRTLVMLHKSSNAALMLLEILCIAFASTKHGCGS
jgi:hypothetical protein